MTGSQYWRMQGLGRQYAPPNVRHIFCFAKNRFCNKLADSSGFDNAKQLHIPDPLTRGSAPEPRWRLCPQVRSRSSPCGRQTLALDPPVWSTARNQKTTKRLTNARTKSNHDDRSRVRVSLLISL